MWSAGKVNYWGPESSEIGDTSSMSVDAETSSVPPGNLSLWFHSDDSFGLKLNLSYINGSDSDLITVIEKGVAYRIRNPMSLSVMISWWRIASPYKSGTLRIEKLFQKSDMNSQLPLIASAKGHADNQIQDRHIVNICVRGRDEISAVKSGSGDFCWLCCKSGTPHWDKVKSYDGDSDSDIEANAEDENSNNSNALFVSADLSGSALTEKAKSQPRAKKSNTQTTNKGREMVSTGRGSANRATNHDDRSDEEEFNTKVSNSNKRTHSGKNGVALFSDETEFSDLASTQASSRRKTTDGNFAISQNSSKQSLDLVRRISELENEVREAKKAAKASRSECDLVVRKFDRRFANEIKVRKEWNAERRVIEQERADLQREKATLALKLEESEHFINSFLTASMPLMQMLAGVSGGKTDSIPRFNASITSGLLAHMPDSGATSSPASSQLVTKPFCIACQSHTADTLILNCGHVCLCYEHAKQMQNNGQLHVCPVCKCTASGICKVRS